MSRPPTFLFKGLWDWKNDQGNGLKDNASMKKRKGRKIVCVGVYVCVREWERERERERGGGRVSKFDSRDLTLSSNRATFQLFIQSQVFFSPFLSFSQNFFVCCCFEQKLIIRDLQREDRGLYQCLAFGLHDGVAMDIFQLDLGGETLKSRAQDCSKAACSGTVWRSVKLVRSKKPQGMSIIRKVVWQIKTS